RDVGEPGLELLHPLLDRYAIASGRPRNLKLSPQATDDHVVAVSMHEGAQVPGRRPDVSPTVYATIPGWTTSRSHLPGWPDRPPAPAATVRHGRQSIRTPHRGLGGARALAACRAAGTRPGAGDRERSLASA